MPQETPPGGLVPGSFRSTISLGRRYVPAPAPGQAAWNEFLRGYAPWGPLGVDPSPTGFAGGLLGRFGRALPYVGGAIGASLAGEAAGRAQGQMVPVPPRDRPGDVLDTLRNFFRFVPGMAGTLGSVGVGVAKGFRDLPEWFKGHPDRTGMAAASIQAPGQGTAYQSPPMIAPAVTPSFASRFNQYNQPGENPFINPSTGVAPAWAGGPSTWNQPQTSWGPEWQATRRTWDPTFTAFDAIPSSTPDYSW